MTYCVAIAVDAGMVFCSDSLTIAGIDQVSTYSKIFKFGIEGERQFVILTAGNLATIQATISRLKSDIRKRAPVNLHNVTSIQEAADYLGATSIELQLKHATKNQSFEASFILGGQIGDARAEIILVYPEGNHITSSSDTPYLQIGESKYGKPILDRILNPALDLDTCALCAVVSMDSTLRSNLSVGPPIDLVIYNNGSLALNTHHRFAHDSDFLRDVKRTWEELLKDAFRQMPSLSWASSRDKSSREQSGAF